MQSGVSIALTPSTGRPTGAVLWLTAVGFGMLDELSQME